MELVAAPERAIARGKKEAPWKVMIYGTPGCGKSTWAAHAPNPFFLDLEAGLNRIECDRTPTRLTTYDEVMDWLKWFYTSSYQTLVVDTLDELDNILTAKVCKAHNKETLVDFGYGKGGELLVSEWVKILVILEAIRAHGKNVLLIGHETIVKFEDPTAENYDKYQLKIHKKSAQVVTAKMDAVFFARYEAVLKERAGTEKFRAVGTGRRVLHCAERPCWVAKNRFGLPDEVEMSAKVFELLK